MMEYKTQIFFGNNVNMADELFNRWIQDKNIKIIDFRYQQSEYCNHSIAILYKEL